MRFALGDHEGAGVLLRRALDGYVSTGDNGGVAVARFLLGVVGATAADATESLEHARPPSTKPVLLGLDWGLAYALTFLGTRSTGPQATSNRASPTSSRRSPSRRAWTNGRSSARSSGTWRAQHCAKGTWRRPEPALPRHRTAAARRARWRGPSSASRSEPGWPWPKPGPEMP